MMSDNTIGVTEPIGHAARANADSGVSGSGNGTSGGMGGLVDLCIEDRLQQHMEVTHPHPVNTPYRHTLSTLFINTPFQKILSTSLSSLLLSSSCSVPSLSSTPSHPHRRLSFSLVHPSPTSQGGRRPPDSHLFPYASTNGWSSSGGGYGGSGHDVTHAKSSRVLEGTTSSVCSIFTHPHTRSTHPINPPSHLFYYALIHSTILSHPLTAHPSSPIPHTRRPIKHQRHRPRSYRRIRPYLHQIKKPRNSKTFEPSSHRIRIGQYSTRFIVVSSHGEVFGVMG